MPVCGRRAVTAVRQVFLAQQLRVDKHRAAGREVVCVGGDREKNIFFLSLIKFL